MDTTTALEHIQVGSRSFAILYPDLLRPLTEVESLELRKSIDASGVQVPVILDEGDGIIDGIHRLRLAAELGLDDVPFVVRSGLADDEKRELARSLNVDRRQLTPEEAGDQRRQRIADRRRAGESVRSIAESEGVSKSQVQRQLSQNGTVEPVNGTVTGRDGRTRTATPKAHDGADARAKADERIARQRNGKPVFDDREIDSQIGKLVRTFDARAEVYGKDGGFQDVNKQMGLLLAAWRRWQHETTGAKR